MRGVDARKRLRELRTRLGLTAKALGEKAGLAQAQVTRLENGDQDFRTATLMELAKALEVPVIYFFLEDLSVLTAATERELKKVGLKPSSRLLAALANHAFLRFAERAAKLYAGKAENLARIDKALVKMPWRRIKRPRGRPRKHK